MAAQIDPENPAVLDTLAEVLAQHGDHAKPLKGWEYEVKFAVRDNLTGLLGTISVPLELK
jgi:hypothetical protein